MRTLVVVHPIEDYLTGAGKNKSQQELLRQKLNDAAAERDAIQIIPYHKKKRIIKAKGITTIYDDFYLHDFNEHDWRKSNNATYAERGRDRLLEILPKNSKIDLAGFKHSACVMQYAMKLSEVYNVRLLEELTDLLCDPRSAVDTGNPENWFYKRLLERGVEFVPHPIQVKLYSLKAINPPVSVPEFWTSEKRGDIFKSCLFLIDKLNIPLENIQYSEQLLYASGLNKPNSVSI